MAPRVTAQTQGVPDTDEVKQQEVLINGVLYDVSGFKHPGGSIIKFLINHGDATEAFNEFHLRSKRAKHLLKSLPHREASQTTMQERGYNKQKALTEDFAQLRQSFLEEGMFDASPTEIAYRLGELVIMHVLGIYLFLQGGLLSVAGLAVLGVAQGRCGWLMHEGGHYSMTGKIAIDKMLQVFLYGTGCGMSASWWRSQHNKHHATPQKLKYDVDLDTLPLVAFNAEIAKKAKSPLARAWLRLQGFLFMPVSCLLVALFWQIFLHPRHMIRTKRFSEIAAVTIRLAAIGYLLSGMPLGQAISCYLFYDMFGAMYIFTNFALSHTHLPVTKPDEYLHWVEYAAKHTTNITEGVICNWWMGYLNFQIEHHLFPSMPQFRHPLIAPRVKALFERHGLVYDTRDYFPCLWDTLSNLHNVGQAASAAKRD